MWISTVWDNGMPPIQWGVVIGASLVAALIDIRTHRIPNRLTGTVVAGGLVWATWTGGIGGLADSMLASVLLATPYVLLFLFAGGGAGDAKMMAGVGAWLGVTNGLAALVAVVASGGLLAIGVAFARKRLRPFLANMARIGNGLALFAITRNGRPGERLALLPEDREMLKMPYGPAIFVGVCIAAKGVELWHI